MGVRLTVGALALTVAAAIGIGIAVSVSRPDSPWCDDGEGVCPDEVLYNDRIYVVECTDHLVGFQQVTLKVPARLRDQLLQVRYHIEDDAATERRAWTVHGVDPADLIVLDERDTAFCEGGPAFAVAFRGRLSALEAAAMLQHLSVASTTTSSPGANASSA
jgi:hypothetical protein